MKRRTFLGLLGLLGCKDELENMKISDKLWWLNTSSGGGAAAPPDYDLLSNVIFHGDFSGLEAGVTNDYGQVDGSNNIVSWKSSPLFPTGVEFTVQGTAPVLNSEGIYFGGSGNLRHSGLNSVFNTLHYRASINDLKSTVIAVVRVSNEYQYHHGGRYGICGNNGNSTLSKGYCIMVDDVSASSANQSTRLMITRGTSSSPILEITIANGIKTATPGVFHIICMEVDNSLALANRAKLFENETQQTITPTSSSTTMSSDPTYGFEIGATGNAASRAVMTLKEFIVMDGVMSAADRNAFLASLINYYSMPASNWDGVERLSSRDAALSNFSTASTYYFNLSLHGKASDRNTVTSIYTSGNSHTYDADKKIVKKVSTDGGLTFGAQSDIWSPAGADAVQDPGCGYDSNGRLHIISDTFTANDSSSTNKLWYLYSDDDGATWSTASDITSILPSDALNSWRIYSKMIENNGRIMFSMRKDKDEGDYTESANYLIYSDDYGTNWSYKTIRAKSATYINEIQAEVISGNNLFAIARNESTLEWTYFSSSDNGDTWSNDGDITFGISMTLIGHPVRINKFSVGGVQFARVLFTDREGSGLTYAAIAKVSDILANGKAAFENDMVFAINSPSQTSSSRELMYGDLYSSDDSIEGVMMYPAGPTTVTVPNYVYLFKLPTFYYPFIKDKYSI